MERRREKERERGKGRGRGRERESVCVTVRHRERERERADRGWVPWPGDGFQPVLCGLVRQAGPGQGGRSGIIRVAADWQAWSARLAPLAAPGPPRGCRPCCRAAAAPPPRGRSELTGSGRSSRPARVGGTVVTCARALHTAGDPASLARALATQGPSGCVGRTCNAIIVAI
jgi:hypothetical protein